MASFYIISGEQYEEYKELKRKINQWENCLDMINVIVLYVIMWLIIVYLDKIIAIGVDRGYIRDGIRRNKRGD